ncbi:MAG: PEP-CTERM sorting domain-containing protein [Sphingomonadaceae bacterium]|nr:PEP-CTERM sorting domain-containing protein [Sphingomonadaceae bacterium]
MQLRLLGAFGALILSANTSAAVYHPDLTGPTLDPTLSFAGGGGFTYSTGPGGLGLYKAGGVVTGEARIRTTFTTAGDFVAKATVGRGALGNVGLDLAAYDATIVDAASTTAFPGFNIFSNGPGDIQSYNINGVATDTGSAASEVTFELRRTGTLYESLLDGVVVNSGTYTAAHPFTFLLSLCAATCIAGNDAADRAGFVHDFRVTTPSVPEPASWALMVAGFGAVGIVARRRRPVIA